MKRFIVYHEYNVLLHCLLIVEICSDWFMVKKKVLYQTDETSDRDIHVLLCLFLTVHIKLYITISDNLKIHEVNLYL